MHVCLAGVDESTSVLAAAAGQEREPASYVPLDRDPAIQVITVDLSPCKHYTRCVILTLITIHLIIVNISPLPSICHTGCWAL